MRFQKPADLSGLFFYKRKFMRTSAVLKTPNISALAREVRAINPEKTLRIFRRQHLTSQQMAAVLSQRSIPVEDTDYFLWSSGISGRKAAEVASYLTIRRATRVFPELDSEILLRIQPEIVGRVFSSRRILLDDVVTTLFRGEPENYHWTAAVINEMTPGRAAKALSEYYQFPGTPIRSYAARIFGNRALSLTSAARILGRMSLLDASAMLAFGIDDEISYSRAAAIFSRMLGHRVARILTIADRNEDCLSDNQEVVGEILSRMEEGPHKSAILSLLPEEFQSKKK